ncbi:hypothetical protein PT974_04524 [Cladobotryum mycophilum]|uniref:Uncharacterized protein n=1 Tax=Cladobotryum mycophilum TaxID=491253 RepID=A0ABR0SVG3_9HYPO
MAASDQEHGLFGITASVQNHGLLARPRDQFADPPPPYQRQAPPQPESPPLPFAELLARYKEERFQLEMKWRSSMPCSQFMYQYREAYESLSRGGTYHERAEQSVRMSWEEQGIWREEWNNAKPGSKWKHEEPLEIEGESGSEWDSDIETHISPSRSSSRGSRKKTSRRQPERYWKFQRQADWKQELNPGPPVLDSPRFNPIFNARDARAQSERRQLRENWRQTPLAPIPHDISGLAYERLKSAWVKRGIWDDRWGVLPGKCWQHEQPLEEFLDEKLGRPPSLVQEEPPSPRRREAQRRLQNTESSVVNQPSPFSQEAPRTYLFGRPPTSNEQTANSQTPRPSSQPQYLGLFAGIYPLQAPVEEAPRPFVFSFAAASNQPASLFESSDSDDENNTEDEVPDRQIVESSLQLGEQANSCPDLFGQESRSISLSSDSTQPVTVIPSIELEREGQEPAGSISSFSLEPNQRVVGSDAPELLNTIAHPAPSASNLQGLNTTGREGGQSFSRDGLQHNNMQTLAKGKTGQGRVNKALGLVKPMKVAKSRNRSWAASLRKLRAALISPKVQLSGSGHDIQAGPSEAIPEAPESDRQGKLRKKSNL